ncbi:E3 ubiquitin-protein ligase dtx3l [Rhizoclosmatium sp. JEL0117]|nr:E3 ubiquitin-protein ligase dtx3l [Rhizoclosmatium sp. JEL0117]
MDLIHPLGSSVIRIDRIVNPVLNDRFNARRTELLKLKSRDSGILKQCGLSDSQIALKIQADMQWDNVHGSALPEYRDNCALLFHGSRASVDDVLSQGLDCRMGKGGLLGRGIYFADSPFKSLNYDSNSTLFIFQVFLGDCLLIPSYSSVQQSVREPLKSDAQKRNKSDLFFDSIVAQPNPGVNEYVIYNSHQCLPLYAITYNRATVGANGPSAQMSFPPFAWRSPGDPVSPPTVWKFNAYTVFDLMSSDSREPVAPAIIEPIIQWKCGHCEAMNDDDFLTCLTCGSSKIPSTRRKRKSPVKQHSVGRVLGTVEILDSDDEDQSFYKKSQSAKNHPLESLGSRSPSATLASSPITSAYTGPICIDTDDSPIIRAPVKKQVLNLGVIALDDSDNDSSTSIHRTQQTSSAKTPSRNPAQLNQADIFSIDSSPASAPPKQTNPSGDIVDLTGDTPSPAMTTTPNTENSTKPVLAPNPEPELEDCPICATESLPPTSFTTLKCKHTLCTDCHKTLLQSGTTMSGTRHSWLKCPFCNIVDGTELGTCPNGTMSITTYPNGLPGFPATKTRIMVSYSIRTPQHSLERSAYFPTSPEGLRIVELMKVAFDRRLVFRIGRSVTTGVDNTLVWGIHHKTRPDGGLAAYGYPDEGYLGRVEEELKERGVY